MLELSAKDDENEGTGESDRLKTPSPATGQMQLEGDDMSGDGSSRKMISSQKRSFFKRTSRSTGMPERGLVDDADFLRASDARHAQDSGVAGLLLQYRLQQLQIQSLHTGYHLYTHTHTYIHVHVCIIHTPTVGIGTCTCTYCMYSKKIFSQILRVGWFLQK